MIIIREVFYFIVHLIINTVKKRNIYHFSSLLIAFFLTSKASANLEEARNRSKVQQEKEQSVYHTPETI